MAKSKKKQAPKPSQKSLPGMEDKKAEVLEGLAENLHKVRSKRMTLTRQEHELAQDLLAAMKKRTKMEYHHGDIHIWRTVTAEKVRVKIGQIDEEQEEAAELAPEQAPAEEEVPEFENEVPDEEEESEDEAIA